MKKIKICSLILASVMAISMAACSPSDISIGTRGSEIHVGTVDPANAKGKVGISMPSSTQERWVRDADNLVNSFTDANYATYVAFADYKIDRQIQDIKKLIKEGVDALIISAVDSSSLTEALDEAKQAGIPVICYDRLIMKSDAISYYVSYDNYTVGKMQGIFVRDQLDPAHNPDKIFNVEFVAGDSADSNARPVYNGAYAILSHYIESGQVRIPSGQDTFGESATPQWDTNTAKSRFKNVLGTYYSDGTTLDAVVCANDTTAAGVIQALDSDYKQDNPVLITGQDGDEINLQYINEGKQSMTIFKPGENEAQVTFELTLAVLDGETPNAVFLEDKDWDFEVEFDNYTFSNGSKVVPSYLLSPVLVTKDNMEEMLSKYGQTETENK